MSWAAHCKQKDAAANENFIILVGISQRHPRIAKKWKKGFGTRVHKVQLAALLGASA